MIKRILTICFYIIFCTASVLIFVLIGTLALDTIYRFMNGIPLDQKLYQGDFLLGLVMLVACLPEVGVGVGFGIWLTRKILLNRMIMEKAK